MKSTQVRSARPNCEVSNAKSREYHPHTHDKMRFLPLNHIVQPSALTCKSRRRRKLYSQHFIHVSRSTGMFRRPVGSERCIGLLPPELQEVDQHGHGQ